MFLFRKYTNHVFGRLFTKFSRSSSTLNRITEQELSQKSLRTESLGQPTPWTHPHLLKNGEVTPFITVAELRDRRNRLLQKIQKESNNLPIRPLNNVVIIPSAVKKYISEKIPYVFRQNSNFFYLTGCLEPDSILVLTVDETERTRSTMFMRPKDKYAELWDGPRTGDENAVELFGVDEAFDSNSFSTEIERKMKGKTAVWYDEGASELPYLRKHIQSANSDAEIRSPANVIQKLRLFKSPAEISLMRQTCRIASEAINETMSETRPGLSEHHLFAMVDYKCRMKNASHLAYPPVVASGTNAVTIHYINNTQMMRTGDLVLMDAGCEYGGYTSDITRTWPINGEFSEPQKVLYDLLLTVQKELIDSLLKEGGEHLDNLFETMCLKLGKYMRSAGIIPSHIADGKPLAVAAYGFCPHHVSHYLGMDVHDTPLISRSIGLLPRMVCTVEPGIYIAPNRKDVPKEFRGLGLRIEDDVLITSPNSVEVLTAGCIKERPELEKLLKR